jgi:pilus assembly protein CpaE
LADGSRVIAIIPPFALDGACLSICRSRIVDDLIENNATDEIEREVHGLSVAILAQDHERVDILQKAIVRTNVARVVFSHLGFPEGTGDRIIREILNRRSDIVIIDLDLKNLQRAIHAIELLRAKAADVSVFAYGEMEHPMNIVATMRAGASEYIDRDGGAEAVAEAFTRFTEARTRTRGSTGKARVFTFVNAKGGAGATTLAVNTALALQRNHGQTVLVDFAPIGHAALRLNVRPSFGVMDALRNLDRLDASLLEGLMTPMKDGLHLLAGPQQPDPATPTAGELARLFDLLKNHYRYVVVDCSGRMDETTHMLSELSNAVLVVAQQDVVSLWSAARIREFLKPYDNRGQIGIVLNRYKEIPGLTEKDVGSATSCEVLLKIPNEPALSEGTEIDVETSQELSDCFRSLAKRLAEGDDFDSAQESSPGGWTPPGGSSGGSAPPAVPILVPRGGGPRTLPPGKADKIQKIQKRA